jgi:hypothetical protein
MWEKPVIWSVWALEIESSEAWAENEVSRRGSERQQSFMNSGLSPEVTAQLSRG